MGLVLVASVHVSQFGGIGLFMAWARKKSNCVV